MRSVVLEFQAELPGFGQHNERGRHRAGAHDDFEMGAAFTPEFEKRWNRYARLVGGSWRMDEAYVKVRDNGFTYRAVAKRARRSNFS